MGCVSRLLLYVHIFLHGGLQHFTMDDLKFNAEYASPVGHDGVPVATPASTSPILRGSSEQNPVKKSRAEYYRGRRAVADDVVPAAPRHPPLPHYLPLLPRI
jgi:hypothetical protein